MDTGEACRTGDLSQKELGMKNKVLAIRIVYVVYGWAAWSHGMEYQDTFKLLRNPIFANVNKETLGLWHEWL